ncbi:MAG: cupin domain-containing protein, partial [Nitratireductor sp.]
MPKASRAEKASLDDAQRRTDIAVGNRVRQLRRVRGRSLKELAQRAGLSIGFLSQIERGLSSASVRALARIAEALEVSIGDVFPAEPPSDDGQRITASPSERKRIDLADSGACKELLTPFSRIPRLDVFIITLQPGGGSGEEAYAHSGEEAGFVMEGGIELIVDGKKHILGEGDSFRFNSNRPHQFRNPGDRPAKALWGNYREK